VRTSTADAFLGGTVPGGAFATWAESGSGGAEPLTIWAALEDHDASNTNPAKHAEAMTRAIRTCRCCWVWKNLRRGLAIA